jgi:Kef-type K+ transport system membrane component KefB
VNLVAVDAISDNTLLLLGLLLLMGLAANFIGQRKPLPRVTLLLLVGVAAGPSFLNVLPEERAEWFSVAAEIALVMIGVLLGNDFTWKRIREQSKTVGTVAAV